jgi:uncharacterized surface protein with fasciclin (FAS1) repeats
MKIISNIALAAIVFTGLAFMPIQNSDTEVGKSDKNIVELASETPSLSTLVQAVKAAGLVEVLQGDGPFTVFAPTNEAFSALPDGTLENLLKPENKDQLVQILTYHVVAGKVMSTDLSDGMSAETVEGSEIDISVGDNGVGINNASVAIADIEASNGVVHVIDTVILP